MEIGIIQCSGLFKCVCVPLYTLTPHLSSNTGVFFRHVARGNRGLVGSKRSLTPANLVSNMRAYRRPD